MNGTTTFDLPIGGMTCASCAGRVERALGKVPGVQRVSVNLANERAHIEVLGQMDPAVLIAAVDKAGPQLNAVIELNPDALDIAASKKEALVKAGKLRAEYFSIANSGKDLALAYEATNS